METPKKNYAFIDGSFNPKTKVYGWGGFLMDQFGEKHIIQGSGKLPTFAAMRNVAGEILGVIEVLFKARNLNMEELTIYYDYEGVANWPLGKWKCNKNETKKYAKIVNKIMKSGLKLYFEHVKGHSGNLGNEEADRLAKEAVGIL